MNALLVNAGGCFGRIFHGEDPDTYCFVPESCLTEVSGGVRVNEVDYLRTRWDVRNMRFNDAGTGTHLFPNPDQPVTQLENDAARSFVLRLQNLAAS